MLIGAACAVLIAGFSAFSANCEKAQEEFFRLHIMANSDSDEDQSLKYDLRDYLLNDLGEIFENSGTAEEAALAAKHSLAYINEKAQAFIYEQGYDYTVRSEVCNMYFTTRVYGNTTLPAGNYNALRLTIGEGKGRNWWCVLFPPLCLPAAEKNEFFSWAYENGYDDEAILTLAQSREIEKSGCEIKFAIYEFFKELFRAAPQTASGGCSRAAPEGKAAP